MGVDPPFPGDVRWTALEPGQLADLLPGHLGLPHGGDRCTEVVHARGASQVEMKFGRQALRIGDEVTDQALRKLLAEDRTDHFPAVDVKTKLNVATLLAR